MSAPAWVAHFRAQASGLSARAGRGARVATCGTCGGPVLRGLDADRAAWVVVVDPYPLTALGELCAVLGGRGTYAVDGRPPALYVRDRWRIAGAPAGPEVAVVADHVCGADLSAYHRLLPARRDKRAISLLPPF